MIDKATVTMPMLHGSEVGFILWREIFFLLTDEPNLLRQHKTKEKAACIGHAYWNTQFMVTICFKY